MTPQQCMCNASWLPPEQAREGGLACTRCGRAWTRGGKQLVFTAEVAAKVAALLAAGGQAVLVPRLDRVVYFRPEQVVIPPGRARIEKCPDCDQGVRRGGPCDFCAGTGWQIWRACPRCGDTAMWTWSADRAGASCQACGGHWDIADPGWLAQRLPERLLTRRQPA